MVLPVAHECGGRSQPSPGRGLYGLPVRDCWSASEPGGGGKVCATTPALEPVPSPRRGGSLASRLDRPVCHGRTGRGGRKTFPASEWTETPVRIAGRPKCALTPRVVSALRYGSNSVRSLLSNATPASRASSCAVALSRLALRGMPDLLSRRNSPTIHDRHYGLRWCSSFNGSGEPLPRLSTPSGVRRTAPSTPPMWPAPPPFEAVPG